MFKKYILASALLSFAFNITAQEKLTPELLWKLKRVGGIQISPDNSTILFGSTTYNIEKNKGNRNLYTMPTEGGDAFPLTNLPGSEFNAEWHPNGKKVGFLSGHLGSVQLFEVDLESKQPKQITFIKGGINGFHYAPDGESIVFIKDVKIDQTLNEKYPDLKHANVHVYDDLMYRHWSSWHDYAYSHVFVGKRKNNRIEEGTDIMPGERFDAPMNPFGGMEQISFNADGTKILYVCKKKNGKDYAQSTNSEIYEYDLATQKTINLTEGMMGYDVNPTVSPNGTSMAFLSMEEDGFESDKNDIVIHDFKTGEKTNLTKNIDITVADFVWGDEKENKIYFEAVINATNQLFELDVKKKTMRQITEGQHNYTSIAYAGDKLIATRQSMLAPNEIFSVTIKKGEQTQLTTFNKELLASLGKVTVKKRMVKTTDGKDMLTWVVYPPGFDETKKYPTILYCQGGPQSAVSQFFSFRWNFNLMASQGYIIVAPNRRGLPGFGQKWNDDISGDWGGQPMNDYLSAIDDVAKESYVDNDKLGCIGASYGGYSAYYLAGIHEKRFKCFISHCGLFNLESWYGSTEELFFANKDIGGPYWGKERAKSYDKFSPHNLVDKWDTPILVIHGEKDYRVPISQGLEAFQAAQLKGIPSKFLYFPTESHWVLSPQNGLVWHREFFSWLDSYLK